MGFILAKLKSQKSTFFVFELILNANCIRADRYIERGFQRFLEFLEYEYAPHKQKQICHNMALYILLYMYLLYSYLKKPILARVILAYTVCIRIVFCTQIKEAIL